MTESAKLYNFLRNSNPEDGLLYPKKQTYIRFKNRTYEFDNHGAKVNRDYLCSMILNCTKNLDGKKVSFTYIDLPTSFTGSQEELNKIMSLDYDREVTYYNILDVARFDVSLDWRDFK